MNSCFRPPSAPVFTPGKKLGVSTEQKANNQQNGNELRDNGSSSDRWNSPRKYNNKKNIQDYIAYGTYNPKNHGRKTVPSRADYTTQKIGKYNRANTRKSNHHIGGSIIQNLRRSPHQGKDRPTQGKEDCRHENASRKAEYNPCRYAAPYPLFVTGTNALSGNNGKAAGKPEDKTIDKSDYVVTYAYRRQTVDSKPAAHNKGIRQCIEDMEKISDQKGKRKSNYAFSRVSAGQES
jgi:hypothetical protein